MENQYDKKGLRDGMREYRIQDEAGEIVVQVVYSARKSLGLQVKSDGTVYARVPRRVSDKTIEKFIQKHEAWILQKRKALLFAGDSPKILLPQVATEEGKRKARALVTHRVEYYADLMGISYGRIAMRNQKTRWGSCSVDGNLNFNCRLLFLPLDLVDYVVVHELAHRRHMDHSPDFWREVARYLPDYKERRERLKGYRTE